MKEIQLNGLLVLVDDGNAQGCPWVESSWQNQPTPIFPRKPTNLNTTYTHPIINWVKLVVTQLDTIITNVHRVLTQYPIKPKYHFYKSPNSKVPQNH